jgi:hypothetical protein
MTDRVAKPWYKSKTMWLNIVSAAIVFTDGLATLLSGLTPIIGPELMPWFVFAVSLANLFLRSITSMGILYASNED